MEYLTYTISTLSGDYITTHWERCACQNCFDSFIGDYTVFIIFQTDDKAWHFIPEEEVNVIEENF